MKRFLQMLPSHPGSSQHRENHLQTCPTRKSHLIPNDSLSSCRIRLWWESSLAGQGNNTLKAYLWTGVDCLVSAMSELGLGVDDKLDSVLNHPYPAYSLRTFTAVEGSPQVATIAEILRSWVLCVEFRTTRGLIRPFPVTISPISPKGSGP